MRLVRNGAGPARIAAVVLLFAKAAAFLVVVLVDPVPATLAGSPAGGGSRRTRLSPQGKSPRSESPGLERE
ncbi:hypothetical protein NKH18_19495 [Streptomyces sp. M10(2022)]